MATSLPWSGQDKGSDQSQTPSASFNHRQHVASIPSANNEQNTQITSQALQHPISECTTQSSQWHQVLNADNKVLPAYQSMPITTTMHQQTNMQEGTQVTVSGSHTQQQCLLGNIPPTANLSYIVSPLMNPLGTQVSHIGQPTMPLQNTYQYQVPQRVSLPNPQFRSPLGVNQGVSQGHMNLHSRNLSITPNTTQAVLQTIRPLVFSDANLSGVTDSVVHTTPNLNQPVLMSLNTQAIPCHTSPGLISTHIPMQTAQNNTHFSAACEDGLAKSYAACNEKHRFMTAQPQVSNTVNADNRQFGNSMGISQGMQNITKSATSNQVASLSTTEAISISHTYSTSVTNQSLHHLTTNIATGQGEQLSEPTTDHQRGPFGVAEQFPMIPDIDQLNQKLQMASPATTTSNQPGAQANQQNSQSVSNTQIPRPKGTEQPLTNESVNTNTRRKRGRPKKGMELQTEEDKKRRKRDIQREYRERKGTDPEHRTREAERVKQYRLKKKKERDLAALATPISKSSDSSTGNPIRDCTERSLIENQAGTSSKGTQTDPIILCDTIVDPEGKVLWKDGVCMTDNIDIDYQNTPQAGHYAENQSMVPYVDKIGTSANQALDMFFERINESANSQSLSTSHQRSGIPQHLLSEDLQKNNGSKADTDPDLIVESSLGTATENTTEKGQRTSIIINQISQNLECNNTPLPSGDPGTLPKHVATEVTCNSMKQPACQSRHTNHYEKGQNLQSHTHSQPSMDTSQTNYVTSDHACHDIESLPSTTKDIDKSMVDVDLHNSPALISESTLVETELMASLNKQLDESMVIREVQSSPKPPAAKDPCKIPVGINESALDHMKSQNSQSQCINQSLVGVLQSNAESMEFEDLQSNPELQEDKDSSQLNNVTNEYALSKEPLVSVTKDIHECKGAEDLHSDHVLPVVPRALSQTNAMTTESVPDIAPPPSLTGHTGESILGGDRQRNSESAAAQDCSQITILTSESPMLNLDPLLSITTHINEPMEKENLQSMPGSRAPKDPSKTSVVTRQSALDSMESQTSQNEHINDSNEGEDLQSYPDSHPPMDCSQITELTSNCALHDFEPATSATKYIDISMTGGDLHCGPCLPAFKGNGQLNEVVLDTIEPQEAQGKHVDEPVVIEDGPELSSDQSSPDSHTANDACSPPILTKESTIDNLEQPDSQDENMEEALAAKHVHSHHESPPAAKDASVPTIVTRESTLENMEEPGSQGGNMEEALAAKYVHSHHESPPAAMDASVPTIVTRESTLDNMEEPGSQGENMEEALAAKHVHSHHESPPAAKDACVPSIVTRESTLENMEEPGSQGESMEEALAAKHIHSHHESPLAAKDACVPSIVTRESTLENMEEPGSQGESMEEALAAKHVDSHHESPLAAKDACVPSIVTRESTLENMEEPGSQGGNMEEALAAKYVHSHHESPPAAMDASVPTIVTRESTLDNMEEPGSQGENMEEALAAKHVHSHHESPPAAKDACVPSIVTRESTLENMEEPGSQGESMEEALAAKHVHSHHESPLAAKDACVPSIVTRESTLENMEEPGSQGESMEEALAAKHVHSHHESPLAAKDACVPSIVTRESTLENMEEPGSQGENMEEALAAKHVHSHHESPPAAKPSMPALNDSDTRPVQSMLLGNLQLSSEPPAAKDPRDISSKSIINDVENTASLIQHINETMVIDEQSGHESPAGKDSCKMPVITSESYLDCIQSTISQCKENNCSKISEELQSNLEALKAKESSMVTEATCESEVHSTEPLKKQMVNIDEIYTGVNQQSVETATGRVNRQLIEVIKKTVLDGIQSQANQPEHINETLVCEDLQRDPDLPVTYSSKVTGKTNESRFYAIEPPAIPSKDSSKPLLDKDIQVNQVSPAAKHPGEAIFEIPDSRIYIIRLLASQNASINDSMVGDDLSVQSQSPATKYPSQTTCMASESGPHSTESTLTFIKHIDEPMVAEDLRSHPESATVDEPDQISVLTTMCAFEDMESSAIPIKHIHKFFSVRDVQSSLDWSAAEVPGQITNATCNSALDSIDSSASLDKQINEPMATDLQERSELPAANSSSQLAVFPNESLLGDMEPPATRFTKHIHESMIVSDLQCSPDSQADMDTSQISKATHKSTIDNVESPCSLNKHIIEPMVPADQQCHTAAKNISQFTNVATKTRLDGMEPQANHGKHIGEHMVIWNGPESLAPKDPCAFDDIEQPVGAFEHINTSMSVGNLQVSPESSAVKDSCQQHVVRSVSMHDNMEPLPRASDHNNKSLAYEDLQTQTKSSATEENGQSSEELKMEIFTLEPCYCNNVDDRSEKCSTADCRMDTAITPGEKRCVDQSTGSSILEEDTPTEAMILEVATILSSMCDSSQLIHGDCAANVQDTLEGIDYESQQQHNATFDAGAGESKVRRTMTMPEKPRQESVAVRRSARIAKKMNKIQ